MDNTEELTKLEKILYPHLLNERNRIIEDKIKFVHYTSSENAVNIIKNKCLWMRNTTCMNDYMEVDHGYKVVHDFFFTKRDGNGKHNFGLCENLELLVQQALKLFDANWLNFKSSIYISSLSEHEKKEDELGRLSMWRAYGGSSGSTALILNNPPTTDGLNIFLHPARYSEEEVPVQLETLLKALKANEDFLIGLDENILRAHIVLSLVFIIVSLKHAGFEEEKEWRIIYIPKLLASNVEIEKSIESIGGVPQIVYKLPLDGKMIPNLNISNMIDKVLIGPSNYPLAQLQAFEDLLLKIDINPVKENLDISRIPLRV